MERSPAMKDIDRSVLSPMMQHYLQTKDEYPDCILFYRLGDFYEMFFDDALTASRELELTLTGKSCGLPERAPMCGVPYHAVESYLTRLVEKGYKAAICEQVEDPRTAKGMVKREVVRVVTQGTNLDMESLDEKQNNFLFCISYAEGRTGVAAADISTGEFLVSEMEDTRRLRDEILRYGPAEILCNGAFFVSGVDLQELRDQLSMTVTALGDPYYDDRNAAGLLMKHFRVSSLSAIGLDEMRAGCSAAGALLRYLYETQKNSLSNIVRVSVYTAGNYMLLDSATRRNLELTQTLREKKKKGSLLWVLDRTQTAMGARLLNRMLTQPLVDRDAIEERLDCVEQFCRASVDRDEIREYLQPVYDQERLMTRVSYGTANPRDLIALRKSLEMFSPIRKVLAPFETGLPARIRNQMDDFSDLTQLLAAAIDDEPPVTVKEGGIIRRGYHEEVDRLRDAKTKGRQWLMDLEAEDQKRTGIKNLRIKYNKVFGYYFEVTNSFKDLVPPDYIRKQTLVGSERYTTPKLSSLESEILGAEDRLKDLEYDLFAEIRSKVGAEVDRIQQAASAMAMLDVFCSLSLAAEQGHYVRPSLNDKGQIRIRGGRHPVVEKMLGGDFIPNDTTLDMKKNLIAVITGPNMAGKSTYMRQVALIALMAQIGSFVPADKADLCVTDRIFTRVGASDDLASGQSTFMVEMNEVANILRNATPRSLLILDEIGRGTSTFDGLSIAWAVIEHISNRNYLGAKTLFATHYHELTELEGKIDNVSNYCIAVKEKGDDIVFLRKIVKGGADRSYGIQVAKLAGLPDMVIDRAKELLEQLSDNSITEQIQKIETRGVKAAEKGAKVQHYDAMDLGQMSFLETNSDEDVLRQLKEIDITRLTPLDALNTLYRLQSELNNRWDA